MIFKGSWLDNEGIPFIPGAHVLETFSPGGSAATTRRRRRRRAAYHHFLRSARGLRDRWDWELTNVDRQAWITLARTPHRRDDDTYDAQANGFLLFNAVNFDHEYYEDTLDVNPPQDPGAIGIAEFLITADLASQVLGYQFSYNALWAAQTQAAVAIYQVDPRNSRGTPHRHHTRRIAREDTWIPGGGVCDDSAPARFPFDVSPDVFVLFRCHDPGVHVLSHLASCTPA